MKTDFSDRLIGARYSYLNRHVSAQCFIVLRMTRARWGVTVRTVRNSFILSFLVLRESMLPFTCHSYRAKSADIYRKTAEVSARSFSLRFFKTKGETRAPFDNRRFNFVVSFISPRLFPHLARLCWNALQFENEKFRFNTVLMKYNGIWISRLHALCIYLFKSEKLIKSCGPKTSGRQTPAKSSRFKSENGSNRKPNEAAESNQVIAMINRWEEQCL